HRKNIWDYSGRIHYAGNITAADFTPEQHKTITAAAIGQGRRETEAQINTPAHAHLDGGSGGVAFFYTLADDGKIDLVVYAKSTSRPGINKYRWDNYGHTPLPGPPPLEHVTNNPLLALSRTLASRNGDNTPLTALPKLPSPHIDEKAATERARTYTTALTNYHTTLTTSPNHNIHQTAAQLATHTVRLRTLGIDLLTHAREQHPDAPTDTDALTRHILGTNNPDPAFASALTHAFDLADPPPAVQIYTALTSDPRTDALLQDALQQQLGQLTEGTREYNRVNEALKTHTHTPGRLRPEAHTGSSGTRSAAAQPPAALLGLGRPAADGSAGQHLASAPEQVAAVLMGLAAESSHVNTFEGTASEGHPSDRVLSGSVRVLDEVALARALARAKEKAGLPREGAGNSVGGAARVSMSPLEMSVQTCLAVLHALCEEVFRHGVGPAGVDDDGVLGVRPQEGRFAPGPGWQAVESWQSVQKALVAAGPGSMAIVLGRRLSGPGHAWAAYALPADTPGGAARIVWLNPSATAEVTTDLPSQAPAPAEARALVVGPSARVVAGALTPFLASTSTAHAMVDPASSHQYGAVSPEYEEKHILEFDGPQPLQGQALAVYVADNLAPHDPPPKIVVEHSPFYRGSNGVLYAWEDEALQATEGIKPEVEAYLTDEIALSPLAALDEDEGRMSIEEGAQLLRDTRQRMAGASLQVRRLRLASLLAGTKWQLTDFGRQCWVVPSPGGVGHPTYAQITVGVPAGGLFTTLEAVQDRYVHPDHADLITGGKLFADTLATRYAGGFIGRNIQRAELPFLTGLPGLDDLRGYAWLLFNHVAAGPLHARFFQDVPIKEVLCAASRTSFDQVLQTLDRRAMKYLKQDTTNVLTIFNRVLYVTIQNCQQRFAVSDDTDGTESMLDETPFASAKFTLRDYLMTGLRGQTPDLTVVKQWDSVGMTDYLLDTNNGLMKPPLVLLELRDVSGQTGKMTDDEVEATLHQVAATSRYASNQAKRFPNSPEVLTDSEAAGLLDDPLIRNLVEVSNAIGGLIMPQSGEIQLWMNESDWTSLAREAARYAARGGIISPMVSSKLQELQDALQQLQEDQSHDQYEEVLRAILPALSIARAYERFSSSEEGA
ncbi:hypothetical protein ACIOWI_36760, partial [Streptomyces sp. NPDC087659]|uniref:hypothetical protein n=1 Tax=Streptomyces sp. NPDC087659 TaxID=3365801 RepID=UPI0037F940C9